MTDSIPKQSLPMEKMLPILQHLLADMQTQKAHAETQATEWRRLADCATDSGREFRQRQALDWDTQVKSDRKRITAVEQTIAVLTVLSHPRFSVVGVPGPRTESFASLWLTGEAEGMEDFHAPTLLEAILKVHDVITARPPDKD